MRVHVKPRDGLLVRDPDRGGYLPPEGALVPDNTYWARRVRDGDVELAPAERPKRTRKGEA